jgi:hypothetical protein
VHGLPALDAIRNGYEVYPVVDAISGTSSEAHLAGIQTSNGRPRLPPEGTAAVWGSV